MNTYGLQTTNMAFEEIPEETPAASVIGTEGDVKVTWNPKDEKEVQLARDMFNSLRALGYLAFRAKGRKAEQGEQITEFDPEAKRLIFVPAMRGG